jgi:hypothetical protein
VKSRILTPSSAFAIENPCDISNKVCDIPRFVNASAARGGRSRAG